MWYRVSATVWKVRCFGADFYCVDFIQLEQFFHCAIEHFKAILNPNHINKHLSIFFRDLSCIFCNIAFTLSIAFSIAFYICFFVAFFVVTAFVAELVSAVSYMSGRVLCIAIVKCSGLSFSQ